MSMSIRAIVVASIVDRPNAACDSSSDAAAAETAHLPFVLKNRPELAVISCGKFNKFNHPSDIVLNRFKITGTEIHRTDREGAVILESNGDSVNVKQWK